LRKQKACSFFKWGLINFFLVIYLVIFIAIFWNDWTFNDETCIADLSWWVLGYLGIQLVHIVRKISIIIIWNKANDPTIAQTKVDLISLPCLILPEIIWYIYGNTLVYQPHIML
jgi:hypothetical protein